jgi:hypothetical protein
MVVLLQMEPGLCGAWTCWDVKLQKCSRLQENFIRLTNAWLYKLDSPDSEGFVVTALFIWF